MFKQISVKLDKIYINGPTLEEGAPHILNIAFEDVRAEVLLHALEQYGVYVSSGSACSSNKVNPKGTLYAIGKKGQELDNAIRFSFSHETTKEDLDEVVSILETQIGLLRKFTLGGKR
ncbi:MAG: aminotransferase class V-fold PLP-dependent enzyme [Cellulosilyticaceae bacterium]